MGRSASAAGAHVRTKHVAGADALRNPALGRQLRGYSRAKTNAVLEHAASMIEQLRTDVVKAEDEVVEVRATLAASTTENHQLRERLTAFRDENARLRSEVSTRAAAESDAAIAEALVSAHRMADEIAAKATRRASEMITAARRDSEGVSSEARGVIEEAERRAHAIVERATAHAGEVQARAEQLKACIERDRRTWSTFLQRALEATAALELQPVVAGEDRMIVDLRPAADAPAPVPTLN
jgi:cell division septum initiation protein DivIVA